MRGMSGRGKKEMLEEGQQQEEWGAGPIQLFLSNTVKQGEPGPRPESDT